MKILIEGILEKDPNNAQLQYNVGFLMLADDAKIVDEINANLKNTKMYNELNAKRNYYFCPFKAVLIVLEQFIF